MDSAISRGTVGAGLRALLGALSVALALVAFPGRVQSATGTVAPPAADLRFSGSPTDGEILHASLFEEPLVPTAATTPRDNRTLASALVAYRDAVQRTGARDAVLPLTSFVETHPASPWTASVLLRLGILLRQTGHYTKALEAMQRAWELTRGLETPGGRALGDACVARLSQFEAYLGREDLLGSLLAEVESRPLQGAAAALVGDARLGLGMMRNHPDSAFRCGPLALERIRSFEHPDAPDPELFRVIAGARSTPNGLSLSALRDLSRAIGLNYQTAFRAPGAALIVPAVVHWKVGHYAAVLERDPQHEGRFFVEDSVPGERLRMDPGTLDEEASGYFLAPPGPLPDGWRSVTAQEGDRVWGRGDTGASHDVGDTGPCSGPDATGSCTGGGGGGTEWSVHPQLVSLMLQNTPLRYTPPVGPPVKLEMVYAHLDAQQPATFNFFNFGNKWTSSWLSYVTDNVSVNGTASLYGRGGGAETYTYPSGSNVSAAAPFTQAVLTRVVTGSSTTGFTRQLRSGAVEQFGQAVGTRFFLSSVSDPQGNRVTLAYDAQMRLVSLADAIGQVTTLTYGLASDPLKVTQVTDPFARSAMFTYTADGHLASITDVLGITSQYTWAATDFVSSLTTPYGTTAFTFGQPADSATSDSQRFLTITDPLGHVSRVEFNQAGLALGIGATDPPAAVPAGMTVQNGGLNFRNTFVWSPTELQAAAQPGGGLDYTKARILHWLYTPDLASTSRVLGSVKEPLENRVWFNYPGQPAPDVQGSIDEPTAVGRALASGTKLEHASYDALGNVVSRTDAAGRITSYTYDANGIDLLKVSNTTTTPTEIMLTLTYDLQHLPVSLTDASGQTSTVTYDPRGLQTSTTDPLGHATTYAYDANGHMTGVKGADPSATFAFTYDSVGRIATAADPANDTVTFAYDAADRPLTATFPDGTHVDYAYHLLELASAKDRLGQAMSLVYDADRELSQITDAAGNAVGIQYSPGAAISVIVDPNGGTTTFGRDIQERLTARKLPDTTTWTTVYELGTSRVASVTDPLNQTVSYSYNADDTPRAAGDSATFAYDPSHRRVVQMTDATGTTTFEYNPVTSPPSLGANRLAKVTSPVAGGTGVNTESLTYDALGRVSGDSVDGTSETATFDPLGRLSAVTNALDTFTYGYSDGTGRVATIATAKGPQAALNYYGPKGDGLLSDVTYTGPAAALIAKFAYAYDSDERVTSFTRTYLAGQLGQQLGLGGGAVLLPGLLDSLAGRGPRPPAMRSMGQGPSAPATIVAFAVFLLALLLARRALGRSPRLAWLAPSFVGLLIAMGCGGDSSTAPADAGADAKTPFDAAADSTGLSDATADSSGPHDAAIDSPGPSDAGATDGSGPSLGTLVTSYSYDTASRLVGAVTNLIDPADGGSTPLSQSAYSYDHASNITKMTTNGATTSLGYNAANEITSPAPASYDLAGSATALGGATYTWDGAHRLASVRAGANESDFSYDGFSRLVRIVDKQSGGVVADHSYMWCGERRCVERDNLQSGSPITKRYFGQGVQMGGQAYYYSLDRQGSVHQLLDQSGAVRAHYEYDAYGNQTKTSGDLESDVTYAGYFHHVASGLDFALHRAYSPALGRWLNRDPIGEGGGLNVYAYVGGDPTNLIDPSGLDGYGIDLTEDQQGANTVTNWGEFTIVGHGPPAGGKSAFVSDDVNGGICVSPQGLANMITSNPDYRGQYIRLYVCHSGTGTQSFAQQLSNIMGIPVAAPTGFANAGYAFSGHGLVAGILSVIGRAFTPNHEPLNDFQWFYPTTPTPCPPMSVGIIGTASDAGADASDGGGPPVYSSFTSTFNQGCFCTTYTVAATDPGGGPLHYTWSNSNPCGQFVVSDAPSATWYHPDSNLPGACPVEAVHSGTITVVIKGTGGTLTCLYAGGSADGSAAICTPGP